MKTYPEENKGEVRNRISKGASQRELSRELGISRYTIQSWRGLRPETKLRQIAPLPKGCPRISKTMEDYKAENKRLKMEMNYCGIFCNSPKGCEAKSKVSCYLPSQK